MKMQATQLWTELWVSFASMLRTYTAAYGLNGQHQATVELGEDKITVRAGEKWLDLTRSNQQVKWLRENGSGGIVELSEAGTLGGQELDMAAEEWARELML